jgi:hypothetical protein
VAKVPNEAKMLHPFYLKLYSSPPHSQQGDIKYPKPSHKKRYEVYSSRDRISYTASAVIKTTVLITPAVTVVGTLNSRQLSQVSTDDIALESIKDRSDKLSPYDCTKAIQLLQM